MKTTKQVRAFIRSMISGNYVPTLYTNKVKDLSTRHVKLYAHDLSPAQQKMLIAFAGNVKYTRACQDYYRRGSPGMIIKCAYVE